MDIVDLSPAGPSSLPGKLRRKRVGVVSSRGQKMGRQPGPVPSEENMGLKKNTEQVNDLAEACGKWFCSLS